MRQAASLRQLALLLPLTAGLCLAQNTGGLEREPDGWSQTVRGTLRAAGITRLKVRTASSILLRGTDTTEVLYTYRQFAYVALREHAARLLDSYPFAASTAGSIAFIHSPAPFRSDLGAELYLEVPRNLVSVVLETLCGTVEAYDLRGSLSISSGGGRLQLDRIEGSVNASTDGGDVLLGTLTGPVRVVSAAGDIRAGRLNGEAWLESGGGSVQVQKAIGPLHVATTGDLKVAYAAKTVDARSAGGRIDISEAKGSVMAVNSSGLIQVGRAENVRMETASGSLRLRDATGVLHAFTAAGSIVADVPRCDRLQDSVLTTASGDVFLWIPSDAAVTVQAISRWSGAPGRIISEFPEIAVQGGRERDGLEARGRINGGGPVLRISATNGTVYLRRR